LEIDIEELDHEHFTRPTTASSSPSVAVENQHRSDSSTPHPTTKIFKRNPSTFNFNTAMAPKIHLIRHAQGEHNATVSIPAIPLYHRRVLTSS
jgi:hypothetical protein